MMNAVLPRILVVTALLVAAGSSARAALVGASGYTNAFGAQPLAADWSTFSIGGGGADSTTAGQIDTAVQGVAASSINAQLLGDATDPANFGAQSVWGSSGSQYVQTRPTGNAATLLMCTLVNSLGAPGIGATISYDYAKVVVAAEEIEGHRAYYSLTGAAGSWVVIPQFSSATPGRLTATLTFDWPNGSSLYLLWADDNGSPSPDTANQIDNFSAAITPGVQTPVSITSHPVNQTVPELAPASFSVALAGYLPPTVQWYSNDVAIPGATSTTYNIPSTPLSYHGLNFKAIAQNVASSTTYFATSSPAVLTVNADLVAPQLVRAVASGLSQVIASFSERLSAASAINVAHYSITSLVGTLFITNATLDSSQTNVIFNVSVMTLGATYTLTVNNVADQSAAANPVPANSQASFMAASIAYADIGMPAPSGNVGSAGNGYDIVASGTNIAGIADQFTFAYNSRADDFDIKVRLDGLTLADNWSKAGFMARENVTAGARYAAAFATPSASGAFFQSRSSAGGATTIDGSFPVNYPNTWLRLRRTSDTFTGFASFDGNNWSQLGTVTLAGAPRPILVGMAVVGAAGNQTVTARFRDQLDVPPGSGTIGTIPLTQEPLGPSSRITGMTISEIMYHSRSNALEFIELFNAGLIAEDLSGYRISGSVNFTFPSGTSLPAGGFLVVARNPAALMSHHSISGVLGPWTGDSTNSSGALPDDEGRIRLRNRTDAVLLEVNYEGRNPWPLAADGSGHSLTLARPSYGEDDPRAWDKSAATGGSPGAMNPISAEPLDSVVINEFLAHTDLPAVDYIELFNKSASPVTIGGAYLSDDRDTNKFRIPPGTILGARSFIAYDQNQLGFALSSGGERIYFVNSNQTRVVDTVAFESQANGISSGRWPDGAPSFHELLAPTRAGNNAGLLIRDVVLNEIMYNPISGDDDAEFVEIYNKGTSPVAMGNWRFTAGIEYQFPAGTVLPTNTYFVVARNPQRLLTNYPGLTINNTFGPFNGTLANGGERVVLSMPDYFLVTNNSIVTTQANFVAVDEVIYGDGGRWGEWADGGGSSLELIDPRGDNRQSQNWADSDETAKAPWTLIQRTATLANLYAGSADEIQVFLLGRGECLVDNIEVSSPAVSSGVNLVANGDFEGGISGWFLGGNHIRSSLNSSEGFGSSRSLHLRASGGGDNGANRIERDLTGFLGGGQTGTIRYRARWLRGYTNVLVRPHNGGMECPGTLIVPDNLGSPGARNSRFKSNNGPAIWDVAHQPILPAASQAVVVSARVHDPDNLGSVQLRYRVDPSVTLITVNMLDTGAGGDAAPNDGIYSATIPGQASGALVAFHIRANDAAPGVAATNLFPIDAQGRECYVRFGEAVIPGNLGIYRLWMNAANINTWTTREELSNEPLDGTLVYGNYRVIYNAGARWRGSPFIRPGYNTPTGSACAYVWSLSDDDLLMGADELNLDSLEPSGRDPTILREPTSFWMADQLGLTFSYQRYVHVVINGIANASRGIPAYADTQQPDSAYLRSWFADDPEGEIFKIDDWFEFDDNTAGPGRQGNMNATLANFTINIGGQVVKDQARYRYSWEKKFNRNLNDDYTRLFALVDALNSPAGSYVSAVENIVNTENYATAFMLRHAIGDWDGYGYNRGKNQFTYRPADGRFEMLLWDLDFSLGCNGGHPPDRNMFEAGADSTVINNFYNNPHTRRICFRAMQRMVDGPFQAATSTAVIDARYRALLANGVAPTSPFAGSGAQGISIPNWISQRRTHMLGLIPAASFAVSGAPLLTLSSNQVVLSGTAPVLVKDIYVNGQAHPVTWTSTTAWTLRTALQTGTNVLRISGTDLAGNSITTTQIITVVYTGAEQLPQNHIVINEILSNPLVPDAEFIELFNTSTTFTFDLSGFEFNGIDYTFPSGSSLGPRSFLVLAKDPFAYVQAYGITTPLFGEFEGNLQANGETISLIKPAVTNAYMTNAVAVVIDRVRYEPLRPWPVGTNGVATASSFQLVDVLQDNSRPCNWSTLYHPAVFAGATNFPGATNAGWRRVIFTGPIALAGTNFWIWFSSTSGGDVYLDDLYLTPGTVAEGDVNVLVNGDFEQPLDPDWVLLGSHSNSVRSTTFSRTGAGSLRVRSPGIGNVLNGLRQFIPPPITNNQVFTLSYWFYSTFDATNLTLRTITGSAFINTTNVHPEVIPAFSNPPMQVSSPLVSVTPGSNNVRTATLVAIPPLWLNEVQTSNTVGILDNVGEREPWIELYNSGTNALALDTYYLANNYNSNLTQWQFPPGSTIAPGEYKIIWADGETGETSGTNLHTNFRLGGTAGSLALVRISNNTTQVLDYLSYVGTGAAIAYGDFPDGQPFYRQTLYVPTPRAANVAQAFPLFINEWMAGNNVIGDPADGNFDDWFEIYNAGPTALDLGGFYLSDDFGDPTRFRIPNNQAHVIPAGGFLVVWADNETNQNSTATNSLHARFQLSLGGEQIGIYTPDGSTLINSVVFGQQTNNLSQGRFTDGASAIFFMTNSTPGFPNVLGDTDNTAPVINPIATRTNRVGQLISFSVTATDPQAPPQTLSFSLLGFPPSGAGITSGGLFTWTPGQEHAYTTNVLTVRVADNGAPSLTGSRNFTIIVLPPPMADIQVNGNNVTLAFDAIPGRSYRVEYKNSLDDPAWTELGPEFQATAPTVMIGDDISGRPHRFYQIVQTD